MLLKKWPHGPFGRLVVDTMDKLYKIANSQCPTTSSAVQAKIQTGTGVCFANKSLMRSLNAPKDRDIKRYQKYLLAFTLAITEV